MGRVNQPAPRQPLFQHIFSGLIGILLALGFLKLGTPVVLDYKIAAPENLVGGIYSLWPVSWGYLLLAVVTLLSLKLLSHWEIKKPRWPWILLGTWLVWQFISATNTVAMDLTGPTLKHFTAASVCFAVGYFTLSQMKDLRLMLIFVLLGYIVLLRVGLGQHFGGLEETRLYFFQYILPTLNEPPQEYIQKISSNRIFSTMFYPNSFAAAILLFLPICAWSGWQITQRFGRLSQSALVFIVILASFACLYWSGSKSGWLIMLVLGLVFLLHTSLSRTIKIALVSTVLLAGAAGFVWKYSGFFEKGATSVVARFDYWKAAVQVFAEKPILGSGPGTFSRTYAEVKSPESEMARLAHNDYLEQACDSGIVGFVAFFSFFAGSIYYLYRYRVPKQITLPFLVWLGILGVSLQAISEFNFYIPALTWSTFLFLGWLWARAPECSETDEP